MVRGTARSSQVQQQPRPARPEEQPKSDQQPAPLQASPAPTKDHASKK
jgi:hypothetical protein